MKVVFLRSALPDLLWMRRYYSSIFPEGARRAETHLNAVKRLIAENPNAGHASPDGNALEFPVTKTPFTIVYRIASGRVEVMRVRDQRRGP
jgi:plasmid stabilization system protein ParE